MYISVYITNVNEIGDMKKDREGQLRCCSSFLCLKLENRVSCEGRYIK